MVALGLPWTGPSPCGQEVTKRKAAAIKIQSLLAKIGCMYEIVLVFEGLMILIEDL